MPRLFEIVPTVSTTRHADGSVKHDGRVMYMIGQDAEAAFDVILKPYERSAAWYLDGMHARSPGPWAYVALRQEYDIANYLVVQRAKLDGGDSTFKFTYYDKRVDAAAAGSVPKVGCLAFYSQSSVQAAARVLRFLDPAWTVLRDASAASHWLLLLDEEPTRVLAEATTCH